MSNVGDSLHRLIGVMDKVGMPVAKNVNPGLSEDNITQQCQEGNIVLPSELVELYRCCNGMKPSLLLKPGMGEYGLDGRYFLLSLGEALEEYERVKESAIYNDELSVTWFPFLREEGGDLYLVDMAAAETEVASVIWWMVEFYPIRKYASLATMFDTLASAYETGAYEYLNDLPYLNENLAMSLIAHQLNPNVAYWRDRVEQLSGS